MAVSKYALLEARVSALEADVAQLKRQAETPNQTRKNWLTETFGVYVDFPDYDQVIEYGRKYRASLRLRNKVETGCKNRKE